MPRRLRQLLYPNYATIVRLLLSLTPPVYHTSIGRRCLVLVVVKVALVVAQRLRQCEHFDTKVERMRYCRMTVVGRRIQLKRVTGGVSLAA